MHEWLAVRRKDQDFEHTPMGFVTTSKPLTSDHPFFVAAIAGPDADSDVVAVELANPRNHEADSDGEDEHEEEDYYGEDGDNGEQDDSDEDGNAFFDSVEHFSSIVNIDEDNYKEK